MVENWISVPGYEGFYEVSDLGRVRSVDRTIVRPVRGGGTQELPLRGVVLKQQVAKDGHLRVGLNRNGVARITQVHHIVLTAFVGPMPEGLEGCHNDGDPTNNRRENLRWDTRSENLLDRGRHGVDPQRNKTHCKSNHEFTPANTRITSSESRVCRKCTVRNQQAYRARKAAAA